MRPNTCPKNANQHPGEILLQNKRKRRTAHQIQEDNEQVEHEWQEKEAAAQHTTEKIASIEDKKTLKDLKILMHAPKPRPRAHPISKSKVSEPNIEYDDGIAEGAAEMEEVEMRNIAADDNDGDEDFHLSEEENAEVQPRNKRLQKTAYREAVHAERSVNNMGIKHDGMSHQNDVVSDADRTKAHGDQKGKKGFIADVCTAKDDYVGMGKTKDWAEKLATSKLLRPQLESLRTTSHRQVSSITTSTAISKISKVTSAGADPTHSPHPTNNVQGNLEEPTTAFLDEDDSLERQAAFKATKKPGARHTSSMDWTGMWRSPFILQTFASHLNFTFGRVEVPDLNTKSISAWAAFALAVTAVYRTLQLIVDGNITFEVIQESRGKRKGMKTNGGDIWTPVITKGEQFAFSKPIWGYMTIKLMGPIVALFDNVFASIVEEAQQYAKHAKSVGNSGTTTSDAPDEDDVLTSWQPAAGCP
ncbi:uncharacterized protein F5147DRAFT_769150 [Suillus discolor]|uniref:Uncharacterized protein n=1 Tax=Suillus discolor TaxID=1912936 RepID=A0A9P7FE39_9AGAM|nr:uncharacterized protein F5147DRAFT_769150 [Suillus discolor]KAG2115731.1 hypothetical protein F5147DRAFT_769150 [Suillus discolor]